MQIHLLAAGKLQEQVEGTFEAIHIDEERGLAFTALGGGLDILEW